MTALNTATSMALAPGEQRLESAVLVERGNEGFAVTLANGEEVMAVRAAGCVIEPLAGDLVLCATAGETAFVLSVLIRGRDEANVALKSSETAYTLSVPGSLAIEAPDVTVRAEKMTIAAQSLNVVGEFFNSLFKMSKRIARIDEITAGNRTIKATNQMTSVEHVSYERMGVHTEEIQGPSMHRAENSFFKAKSDIRFDGERFTMG